MTVTRITEDLSEVWGVTRFNDTDEGILILELFATEDCAIAFRDGYATKHTDRRYNVTKFKVWR